MARIRENQERWCRTRRGACSHTQVSTPTSFTALGQTALTTLHSSTPSFRAARKSWSVAYGGAMPVHSRTNWEAALRFAARLGRAWLAGQCFTGLVLDVLDSEMRRPSCSRQAKMCSAGAAARWCCAVLACIAPRAVCVNVSTHQQVALCCLTFPLLFSLGDEKLPEPPKSIGCWGCSAISCSS